MKILGIETTCDETAAAVVKDGSIILSNIIASQTEIHQQYGGVYPELASRFHFEMLLPIIDHALQKANITPNEIDAIAIANEPGLIGALLIGLNVAKSLAYAWNKPFVGINHVHAHLYASLMSNEPNPHFPALGLVLSGGHTLLFLIENFETYTCIGSTIDDAIGEAFDKVAVLLGLSYPGGPKIEKLAQEGDPLRYSSFKAGNVSNNPYNFSFSGLKTKVLYTVKGQSKNRNDPSIIDDNDKKDIAASFQHIAFTDIIEKTLKAAKEHRCKAIYIGGGVSNNKKLREMFHTKNEHLKNEHFDLFWPSSNLCLDNAAMIAGLAYHKMLTKKEGDLFDLDVMTRIFPNKKFVTLL